MENYKIQIYINNDNNNDEITRKLLNFDKFSKKLITNQPCESYGELNPIRLLMYGEEPNYYYHYFHKIYIL